MFLPQETVLHELFQHVFFTQDAVLQERTAPVWVPQGPQVSPLNLPGACSSIGSPWTAASVRPHPWASACSWLLSGYLLCCGPPWVAEEQHVPPWLAGKSLLQHLQHLLSLYPHWHRCPQGCFTFSHCPLTAAANIFYPSLNVLPCHDHCWWAQL